MKKSSIKKLAMLTFAFGAAVLLAGCGGGCGDGPHHMKKQHMRHNQPQEVVMYEAEAVEVVEMQPMLAPVMVAKMQTRSSKGGTSEMGTIKFTRGENGVQMMVDLVDLRPNTEYTVKIYPCGNCGDNSCCAKKCMNVNLPMLSIDEPGRLTQTYNVSGITCDQLQNAKIVLMRDGGHKAAWGKFHQKH